jgi:predicted RNase H-like HicB family nuclease
MEYTSILNKTDNWWVGWIKEIPGVSCQEETRQKLLESLRTTLKEALEFNKQDALSVAGERFEEEVLIV